MYIANRGYAMDTCIMCVRTICIHTTMYIHTVYIIIYIYAYIHYSIIIYGLPFFFNASPLRGPMVLHMGNLPAALPAMPPSQQSTFFPLGPTLFPGFFPRLTSHREERSKSWSAKTNRHFTCNKVKISTGKSEDCAKKNICSSTCTNQGFTGKTWRGPLQTRGYHKHSQGHNWHLDGQKTYSPH